MSVRCKAALAIVGVPVLLLLSCKKDDEIRYTFNGTVTESVDHLGLSGVAVVIGQKTYDGNVAGSYFNTAGSAVTDASGFYEISFDREKVFEFRIGVSKENYFEIEDIIGSGETSVEDPNTFNFTLEPKSWVRFNLFNAAPLSADDFTLVHYNFREDCGGCAINDFHHYYGAIDTSFTYLTTGGLYARFGYKNPGSSVYIQDSVYTTPFDTAVINISY